ASATTQRAGSSHGACQNGQCQRGFVSRPTARLARRREAVKPGMQSSKTRPPFESGLRRLGVSCVHECATVTCVTGEACVDCSWVMEQLKSKLFRRGEPDCVARCRRN